ncbi:MAG: class I SAM-dependent methyltransferase [Pseudomonadota bacterium]
MMFGTREEFDYFQCEKCGCLQIKDIPPDLHRFYPDNYYSLNISPNNERPRKFYSLLQKQRCRTALFGKGYKLNRLIRKFVELPDEIHIPLGISTGEIIRKCNIKDFMAPILDVGCGSYSSWLDRLQILGFENLTGIDPYIAENRQHGKVRVLKSDISCLTGQFDLITFHHSFEHIADQLSTLQKIKDLLSPDGVCLIRIPVVSSYAWEKYGINWVELDAPRHLYLHSNLSMESLVRKAGLKIFDTVYDSLPFEFYGSEQYARNIPLNDKNSLWTNPHSTLFSIDEIASFEALAKKVNKEKKGGRAGFYLRRTS